MNVKILKLASQIILFGGTIREKEVGEYETYIYWSSS